MSFPSDDGPTDYSSLLPRSQISDFVRRSLNDDCPSFDVGGLVVGTRMKSAQLLMKSPGVFAGKPFFQGVFDEVGCKVDWADGASIYLHAAMGCARIA